MNTAAKKLIKYVTYTFLALIAATIALFPFLRKDKDFTTNYSPETREAEADAVYYGDGDGGGDDDGGI